jgi:hypothetical protein
VTSGELLTMEQVRRAADVFLAAIDLPPQHRRHSYQAELDRQDGLFMVDVVTARRANLHDELLARLHATPAATLDADLSAAS